MINSETDETAAELLRLIAIMKKLRSAEGCPWDRKQTCTSLKPYLLEETYELLEALDAEDPEEIRDELGDLLLQIVFLAQIHDEQNNFDMADVAASINGKMIRRHPHVFAGEDSDNHAQRWEQIKQEERSGKGKSDSLDARISRNLPALKRAAKVAKKAQQEKPERLLDKIATYTNNLKEQINKGHNNAEMITELLGQILYTTASLGSTLKVDAEEALRLKTRKVIAEIDD